MALAITVLDPFAYGITVADIRQAAYALIDRPEYFKRQAVQQEANSEKLDLLHYFFKELSASQKYNVLRSEPVARTIRQEVAALLERHGAAFTPRAVYTPVRVLPTPDGVAIAETAEQLRSQLLHNFFPENNMPGASLCFLYVVTVGPAADQIIKQYGQQNQPLEAFVMNSIAAALADTLAECLQRYLERQFRAELGQAALQRYSPGYRDWHLADQAVIFRILEPARRIGVSLTEAFLMHPLKSTSGIMGVKLHSAQ